MNAPDESWIKMLSTQGLGVVFAMVCIFCVLPGCAFGLWKFSQWVGVRADRVLNSLLTSYSTSVTALQQGAETDERLEKLILSSGTMDDSRHIENQKLLGEIREGVHSLQGKVDALPERIGEYRRGT